MNTPIGSFLTKTWLKWLTALLASLGIGLAMPSTLYAQPPSGLSLQLEPSVAGIGQTVDVGVANWAAAYSSPPTTVDPSNCFSYGDGLNLYLDVSGYDATNDAANGGPNFVETILLTPDVDANGNPDMGYAWGTFTPENPGYYGFALTEDLANCYNFDVSTQAWLLVVELTDIVLQSPPQDSPQFQQLPDLDYAGFVSTNPGDCALVAAIPYPNDPSVGPATGPYVQWAGGAQDPMYDWWGYWEYGGLDAYVDATVPAQNTPQITLGTQTLTADFNIWFISATLNYVIFGDAGLNNFQPVASDIYGSAYLDPQWSPSGNCSVSYAAGAGMAVQPNFTVTPSTYNGPILFQAVPNAIWLSFPTFSNPTPGWLNSQGNIPNAVAYLHPLALDWQCSLNSGAGWNHICTSANTVYVTLSKSKAPVNYETVLYLACFNAGATTAASAAANTWALFSVNNSGPANVNTWNNRPLYYYKAGIPWANNNVTVADLLYYQNGQCAAWRQLLAYAWAANGIVNTSEIEVDPSGGNNFFLVNTWGFSVTPRFGTVTPPVPYPYALYMDATRVGGSLVPTTALTAPGGSGDLANTAGVPGQNSPTPAEKGFSVHYIESYGENCYDPSYGLVYANTAGFQNQALAGVTPQVLGPGFMDGYGNAVNGPAGPGVASIPNGEFGCAVATPGTTPLVTFTSLGWGW